MRRSTPRRIGDLLNDFVRVNEIGYKLKETEVVALWGEMMGPAFRRYMKNVTLVKGVLYVEVSSPVVRSELMMSADDLRKRLNDMVGQAMVNKIVFR